MKTKVKFNRETKKRTTVSTLLVVAFIALNITSVFSQPPVKDIDLEKLLMVEKEEKFPLEDWMVDVELFCAMIDDKKFIQQKLTYLTYSEEEEEEEEELPLEDWMVDATLFAEMVNTPHSTGDELEYADELSDERINPISLIGYSISLPETFEMEINIAYRPCN